MLDYNAIKEESVTGRYITHHKIAPFLDNLSSNFIVKQIGESVKNNPIYSIEYGNGDINILMWSQMHGNESTTTRALLDFLNFLDTDHEIALTIKASCSLTIVPILNPDGAEAYTRVNANLVDLNRDAQNLTQPESLVLRNLYNEIQPHFCYNLHGQRTIFNVGKSPKPATISFLTPSQDEERSITPSRIRSMQIIATMNNALQKHIPHQVGRYDDSFNANCVGDTFQMLNTPTILFEAGHYHNDYGREFTREYIFYALVSGTHAIGLKNYDGYSDKDYFEIPENGKLFFDVLIANPHLIDVKFEGNARIGILYKEVLKDNTVCFEPYIAEMGELANYYGHSVYDCSKETDLKELKKESVLMQILK
ncbi:hypothetical protein GGR42_000219 [Saonia flava]|uniref:Peptidase M14 domain-containing protein n=1 Tax=Saonia flava TaxID=523696 RepID=A0A846QRD7_9FLAO|nr:M14 metallopeptidase family protein [Saonia flava]NJB69757.1 hypothetical protein [Saonia flava]